MKARALIHVSGIVQGVGYRWFVEDYAKKIGLKGYVMNLPDGRVEIVAEGEKEQIEELLEYLRNNKPRLARVDKIDVKWQEYKGEFEDFRIRYY